MTISFSLHHKRGQFQLDEPLTGAGSHLLLFHNRNNKKDCLYFLVCAHHEIECFSATPVEACANTTIVGGQDLTDTCPARMRVVEEQYPDDFFGWMDPDDLSNEAS